MIGTHRASAPTSSEETDSPCSSDDPPAQPSGRLALCKQEVTGSIPVGSMSAQRDPIGDPPYRRSARVAGVFPVCVPYGSPTLPRASGGAVRETTSWTRADGFQARSAADRGCGCRLAYEVAGRAARSARMQTLNPRPCLMVAGLALDRACQLDARGDVELAEDVAQVRLDRLEAEEQLGGDLGVRPAIDDERGDLALALGQRVDAGAVGAALARAAVHGTPELAQLALGGVAQARRAAPVERRRRVLELGQ